MSNNGLRSDSKFLRFTPPLLAPHANYRPDIDGLRAIAVLAVVAFHAYPAWIKGGFVGVDVFFVISGFLISTILFRGMGDGTFSFGDFYMRRARRIFPALVLVLLVSLGLGWFLSLPEEFARLGKHVAGGAGFVSNLTLLSEHGYFDAASDQKALLHLWSLGIEEQFYLLFPALLWLATRAGFAREFVPHLVVAGSFLWNLAWVQDRAAETFYLPQTRVWELMLGALLAIAALKAESKPPAWILGTRGANARSAFGLALIAISVAVLTKDFRFPGAWGLLPTLGAVLVISAGPRAALNRRFLSLRPLVWIGTVSYPLYLWHWVLLVFARGVDTRLPQELVAAVAVAASFVLAWATQRWVEAPLRFGGNGPRKAWALTAALLGTGALGYAVYSSQGAPNRFPPEVQRLVVVTDYHFREHVRAHECHVQDPDETAHAPHCIESGRPQVALWGDSHGAALYPGLRKLATDRGFAFTQLTTAGCGPILGMTLFHWRLNCGGINEEVLGKLTKLQPEVLLLHAAWIHFQYPLTAEEFREKFSRTLREVRARLPKTKVIVIGPVPRWIPTQQQKVYQAWLRSANKHQLPPVRIPADLPMEIETLVEGVTLAEGFEYLSAIRTLCDEEGCISRTSAGDFTGQDDAHLNRFGSVDFVERIADRILATLPQSNSLVPVSTKR